MIRFSCNTENFGDPVPETCFAFIKALGYDAVNVSCRQMMPQDVIAANPKENALRLKDCADRYGLALSELFLNTLEIDGKKWNCGNEASRTDPRYAETFDKICQFASAAGMKSIMGTAAGQCPPEEYEERFACMAAVLKKQCEIAASYGLAFHVEPYRLTLIREPEAALRLIEEVPQLRYSLDFIHFAYNSIPLERVLPLLQYAGHLHIRQALPGIGKCAVEKGVIDYDAVVKEMARIHWSGDVCSEFWSDESTLAQKLNPVEQNIVMRYQFKNLCIKYGLME